jgi:hypothetical protein
VDLAEWRLLLEQFLQIITAAMLAHAGLARTELFQAEEMLFLEAELQLMVPQALSLVLGLDTAAAVAAPHSAESLETAALVILAAVAAVVAAWRYQQDPLLASLGQVAQAATATFSSFQCKENQ